MKCPSCQTENPGQAKLCMECGYRFAPSSRPVVENTFSNAGTVLPATPSTGADEPIDSTFSGPETIVASADTDRKQTRQMTPGTVIGADGRYVIIEQIGQGGMGVVYTAKDSKLDRVVALKRLLGDGGGKGVLERFDREAKSIAALSHANIVTVYDYDRDDDGPYIVMEYVGGEALDVRLHRAALSEKEAVTIFEGVCLGVAYAHRQKIIHRDLKPANVMLTKDGIPKLLDFGLARGAAGIELSATGYGMGTLDYAAPEQKRDASSVDHRADVYSLGATFYELLTGLKPVPLLVNKAPAQWQAIIGKACEPRPADRFSSVDELLEALSEASQGASKKVKHTKKIPDAHLSQGFVCKNCGDSISGNSQYCPGCGSGLDVQCPACSAHTHSGKPFCDKCGVPMSSLSAVLRAAEVVHRHIEEGELERASGLLGEALAAVNTGAPVGAPGTIASFLQVRGAEIDQRRASSLDHLAKSEAAERSGDAATALEEMRQAARVDVAHKRALAAAESRLIESARVQWIKNVKLSIKALVAEKKFEDAIELIESNLKDIPSLQSTLDQCRQTFPERIRRRDARRHVEEANHLARRKSYEKALKAFEAAVSLDPTHQSLLDKAKQEYPALIHERNIETTANRAAAALAAKDLRLAGTEINNLGRMLGAQARADGRYIRLSIDLQKSRRSGKEVKVALVTTGALVVVLIIVGIVYAAWPGPQVVPTDPGTSTAAETRTPDRQQPPRSPSPGPTSDNSVAEAQKLAESWTTAQASGTDFSTWFKRTKPDVKGVIERAADRGDASAQHLLGLCYSYGQGMPEDDAQAAAWFRKAADQGYAEAQFSLGVSYNYGHGVTQDYVQAVMWYRKAAEQGHAQAQTNLGLCYHDGEGVAQDFAQAVAWYRKAAEQGHANAQTILGACYMAGQGVTQDYPQAVAWFRKAAEQEDAWAQFNLGYCYQNGHGVVLDYTQALAWYRKAADQGHDGAKRAIATLNKTLEAQKELEVAERAQRDAILRRIADASTLEEAEAARREYTGTKFTVDLDRALSDRRRAGFKPVVDLDDEARKSSLAAIGSARSFNEALAARATYTGSAYKSELDDALAKRLAAIDTQEFTRLSAAKPTSTMPLQELNGMLAEVRSYLDYKEAKHRQAAEKLAADIVKARLPLLTNPENYDARSVVELPAEFHNDVANVSISSGSSRIAFRADTKVVVFDLSSKQVVYRLDAHYGAHVALSDSGELLAASTARDQVKVINLSTKAVVSIGFSSVSALGFAPDGKKIAIAGHGKIKSSFGYCAAVFRVSDGNELCRTTGFNRATIEEVGFVDNSSFFTFDSGTSVIAVWSAATGTSKSVAGGQGFQMNSVVSVPGKSVLIASQGSTLVAISTSNGKVAYELAVEGGNILALNASPDGKYLCVSTASTLYVYSVTNRGATKVREFSVFSSAPIKGHAGFLNNQLALISVARTRVVLQSTAIPD